MRLNVIIATVALGIIFGSCANEENKSEDIPEKESQEELIKEVEIADVPVDVEIPFVEGYLEDWEGIKGSLLLQDADSVGLWGTMYGLNAEELVELVKDEKITEKLKATAYEDLIPDPKGEKNYFRFEAENSTGGNLKMFIVATPYTLMIDYYIFQP